MIRVLQVDEVVSFGFQLDLVCVRNLVVNGNGTVVHMAKELLALSFTHVGGVDVCDANSLEERVLTAHVAARERQRDRSVTIGEVSLEVRAHVEKLSDLTRQVRDRLPARGAEQLVVLLREVQ